MTEEDIIEFFKECHHVHFLPKNNLFPFEIGQITFAYRGSYYLDWVVFSQFFQENFLKTYNIIEVTEKENGKIDFRFQVNTENKQMDIVATDLNYNKDSLGDFRKRQRQDGEGLNLFFNCLKDTQGMMAVADIDPNNTANQPIHITSWTLTP